LADGRVQAVTVIATVGGPLRLLSPWKTILVNGKAMALGADGVVTIAAKPKATFTFRPGKE